MFITDLGYEHSILFPSAFSILIMYGAGVMPAPFYLGCGGAAEVIHAHALAGVGLVGPVKIYAQIYLQAPAE